MPFNLKEAMGLASKDRSRLIDEFWPIYVKHMEKMWKRPYDDPPLETKLGANWAFDIPDEEMPRVRCARLNLLRVLVDVKVGKFWHCPDYWEEAKKCLSEADAKFYATLIIEMAKKGFADPEPSVWSVPGHSVILEWHRDGKFKGHISGELLKEAATMAVWEMMQASWVSDNPHGMPSGFSKERVEVIGSYTKCVDIQILAKLAEGTAMWSPGAGVPRWYSELINRSLPDLTIEGSSWLLRPRIDALLYRYFIDSDDGAGIPYWSDGCFRKEFRRRLGKYLPYMKTRAIRTLLQVRFAEIIESYHYQHDQRESSDLGPSIPIALVAVATG